jgi:hypothetical protein
VIGTIKGFAMINSIQTPLALPCTVTATGTPEEARMDWVIALIALFASLLFTCRILGPAGLGFTGTASLQ